MPEKKQRKVSTSTKGKFGRKR